jgi:hypothetical protein
MLFYLPHDFLSQPSRAPTLLPVAAAVASPFPNLSLPLGTLSPRFSHYRDRPQQQPPETARSPCRVPKADPARPCAADRPGRQQPSAMSTSPKRDAATPPGTCMHPSSSTDRAKPKSEHPTRPTHTAARPTVSPGIIELQCIRFSLPH